MLRAIADKSPNTELIGTDIDPIALKIASEALPSARFERLDAIQAFLAGQGHLSPQGSQLDGIVLNPPWGIELSSSRSDLREGGFELARGQCDSADFFLEMAVKLLPRGGAAALILPDSLFFPDRAPVRRFLLENCSLDLVARLGEGFFPGVFRGTGVIVLRRGKPTSGHEVECLRLSQTQKRLVLADELSLAECVSASAHFVRQSRFTRSESASFSIDVRQADLVHVRAVYRHPPTWTRTLTGGRGVELSKHGEVVLCPHCGCTRPRPRKLSRVSCKCGGDIDPVRASAKKIVRAIGTTHSAQWEPLIAGEDVRRYCCSPSREIRIGLDGINYKQEIDRLAPRLLIRKTGIGLKASIYRGRALTTQTVFHYQATKETPAFLLSYALGVLSSRVMLAVHLKRTGESEWRSHPYVTQKLLAELPIPHPTPDTQEWRQAGAIADLVSRSRGRKPSTKRDLKIESLVAGLYGLDPADLAWVDRVLNEAQGMEGIMSLRLPAGLRLEPMSVD